LRYRGANKSPVDAVEEEVLFDVVGSLVRPQPVCRVPVQQQVYQLPTRQANLHAFSFFTDNRKIIDSIQQDVQNIYRYAHRKSDIPVQNISKGPCLVFPLKACNHIASHIEEFLNQPTDINTLIRHIELVSLFISFQTPFRRELGSIYQLHINLII
jgi:hypothetical protein